MRTGEVFVRDDLAGEIRETDSGYVFQYDPDYLSKENAVPVSLTMPLQKEPYVSRKLFPFFDGLLPEGWLFDLATKAWKTSSADRFGLLIKCCADPIGIVTIREKKS